MSKLMGLQFRIVYRKGRENLAADALSRMGSVLSLQTVSEVQPMWLQEILNSYMTDPVAQQLLAQLAVSSPNEEGFSIHQGLIKKGISFGWVTIQLSGPNLFLFYMIVLWEVILVSWLHIKG